MDEYMSDKAKKMKAQIEQVCVANKDRVRYIAHLINYECIQIIEFIEKKEFPEFFVRIFLNLKMYREKR